MLKKVLTGTGIAAVLTAVFLLGSLFVGTVLAQSPDEGQAGATISAAEAEAIALKANPGATVVDTEREKENGVLIYGVELSNGKEVEIDASTGAILSTESSEQEGQEIEDADDEDNDDVEEQVEEENEDDDEAEEGIEDDIED